MKSIPNNPKKIVLVNPTKYLGNFLIAGGLIQDFYTFCTQQDILLKIVVDSDFKNLISHTLPKNTFIYYPRRKIKRRKGLKGLNLYLKCLKEIRQFKADLAFVVEEDTVAHRLTLFSGARYKLGCSGNRHKKGYDHVLPIDYETRPQEQKHRWFSYKEVFQALGFVATRPDYIKLKPLPISVSQKLSFEESGLNRDFPLIVIHAGATKAYKKWPIENFIELGKLLIQENMQPVLIGAGPEDQEANQLIQGTLNSVSDSIKCVDLCNQMNLSQLASFLNTVQGIVGNDSGPFHLASALKVPGVTIYGPTEIELWGPLSQCSQVVQGEQVCVPECRQPSCLFDHQCLKTVLPAQVFTALLAQL